MKKLLLLIQVTLIFLAFFKTTPAYSWDTTAAKFYPLNVGNYYVFEEKHLIMNCSYVDYTRYHVVEIVSDTVFPNGKKYYKFDYGPWWSIAFEYQRVDSNSMNVYSYNTYTSEEKLLDSLFANKGDTYLGKRNPFCVGPCVVNDTTTQYLLNATRRIKNIISGGAISFYYSLVEGLGFYSHSDCELGTGSIITLKGCIINGIIYGDTTSRKTISNEIPEKLKLYQNYPNPFNPTTSIKFDIPRSSHVKLFIYDALGREVAIIVNEKLSAGSYETSWNGGDYPSGVYFYALLTNYFRETKKMVITK